jgi:predicted GNAT family acetyltransferase
MEKWNLKALDLINNDSGNKKRFEIHIEGQTAFMDYMISKQHIIFLTHTEVPKALEGQGVGFALASKVLDFVRDSGLKMAPLCPFLAAYLKRHPEKADGILAPGYSVGK